MTPSAPQCILVVASAPMSSCWSFAAAWPEYRLQPAEPLTWSSVPNAAVTCVPATTPRPSSEESRLVEPAIEISVGALPAVSPPPDGTPDGPRPSRAVPHAATIAARTIVVDDKAYLNSSISCQKGSKGRVAQHGT